MSRRKLDVVDVANVAFCLAAIVAIVAVVMELAKRPAAAPTVTVPAWEPPIRVDVEPCPEPSPTPVIGRAVGRRPVACISNGARMLCPPPETNFDALDAECARKFLALVAREGAEDGPSPRDWSRYRAERFEAAHRVCEGFRR